MPALKYPSNASNGSARQAQEAGMNPLLVPRIDPFRPRPSMVRSLHFVYQDCPSFKLFCFAIIHLRELSPWLL